MTAPAPNVLPKELGDPRSWPDVMTLGPEDSAALAAALLNAPVPTEKLKAVLRESPVASEKRPFIKYPDPAPVGDIQKCASLPETKPAPKPRNMPLPLGGQALMYTRENLTQLYRCSHGELGRLLSRRMAPLPIRFDGQILWFADEALRDQAQVIRTLERWRTKR